MPSNQLYIPHRPGKFPTRLDQSYWQFKQPHARIFGPSKSAPRIDELVNAHAGIKIAYDYANTIVIFRLWQDRQRRSGLGSSMLEFCIQIITSPQPPGSSRYTYCLRILNKLAKRNRRVN